MATVVRAGSDLYATLGVDPAATGDEIARAFRTRAKQLHPDASDDPHAPDEFGRLVAAYEVLSNHRTRREYDEARAAADAGNLRLHPGPSGGASGRAKPWTVRRSWTVLVAGIVVTLLGFGAAFLTWHLHARDARHRAHDVPVVATRVGDGDITFRTRAGRVVVTREPHQHGEGSGLGPTVGVRYDPADPRRVVVDASSVGRDLTLGIVALKLLVGGPVFVVLGARRLRRATAAR